MIISKIRSSSKKIFDVVVSKVKTWDFYSPIIFLITYLLAYSAFTLIVQSVSFQKFFYFWVVMDASMGICRVASEKIAVYKSKLEEEFLSVVYLISMVCVLILVLLLRIIFL